MVDTAFSGFTQIDSIVTADEWYIFDASAAVGSRDKRAKSTQVLTYLQSGVQTFTNKTMTLGGNTVSGTKAQFDAALTDGDFVYVVGTPVDNQIGVWTGDGTIEGDAGLTFDTTSDTLAIAVSGDLAFGAVVVLSDLAGTMTLQNIDVMDTITKNTIKTDITTLANLTSALALAQVGVITTGIWQGEVVASAFLDTDTMHLSVAQTVTAPKTFEVASAVAIDAIYSDAGTNTVREAINVIHKTSADMVDGFGPAIVFEATDDTANNQELGLISFVRNGLDNTGKFILRTVTNGTKNSVLEIENDGATNWVAAGPHTRFVINEDDTGNRIRFARYKEAVCFEFSTDVTVGDGKFYTHTTPKFNSYELVYVHAQVVTAGTTGTTDVQIRNVTQAVDMLTTKLTVDSGETGSDTAAVAAVIDTANDDVATNDLLRIDVDAVSTTPPKGLIVTMGFKKP